MQNINKSRVRHGYRYSVGICQTDRNPYPRFAGIPRVCHIAFTCAAHRDRLLQSARHPRDMYHDPPHDARHPDVAPVAPRQLSQVSLLRDRRQVGIRGQSSVLKRVKRSLPSSNAENSSFNSIFHNHLASSGFLSLSAYNVHIFLDRARPLMSDASFYTKAPLTSPQV
jgi:hypothetical protein